MYTITKNTNILISKGSKTQIIEIDKSFTIEGSIYEIITFNCYIYGSSLKGRQQGSAYLLGNTYKPPIILSETADLILVPTTSFRNKKCSWINLSNVLNYYPEANNKVLLEFKNLQKVKLNISYYVLDKQILRATRLESSLRGRNIKKAFN